MLPFSANSPASSQRGQSNPEAFREHVTTLQVDDIHLEPITAGLNEMLFLPRPAGRFDSFRFGFQWSALNGAAGPLLPSPDIIYRLACCFDVERTLALDFFF
jgi:hypothetical protein